jgi:hypothetical protein
VARNAAQAPALPTKKPFFSHVSMQSDLILRLRYGVPRWLKRLASARMKLALGTLLVVLGSSCGGGASGGPCAASADCAATAVCVASTCVAAGGRTYAFHFRSATVPARKSSGLEWDAYFPLPDVFATLKVDLQAIGQTAIVQDSTSPTWTDTLTAKLENGSRVEIQLWDSDTTSNDLVDSFVAEDAVPFVHAGGINGPIATGSPTSLVVEVVPQ